MNAIKTAPIIIACFVGIGFVLFVHSVIKLPSEAFLSSPVLIYENYAFAMALGFGLPMPMLSSAIILLIMMLLTYLFWRWVLRIIFKKRLAQTVADQTEEQIVENED